VLGLYGPGEELYPAGKLRSRCHSPASVVVAAFDLDDVRAVLALMLRRESACVHVTLGAAAPPATTTREPPAVRHAGHGGP
jgi:hypothetical protein